MRRAHLWTSSQLAGRRRTELVDCSFAQPKHSKLDGGMLLRGDHISNILFTRRALVFNIPLNCSPQVKEDYVQDTSHKLLGFSEEFPTYLSLGELVGLSFSTHLATLRKFLSSRLVKLGSTLLVWYTDSNQQPIPKGMRVKAGTGASFD